MRPAKYHLTVNNIRLGIRDWDSRACSACCLLIHGLADGGFVWDDFAQQVVDCCRIVALDLRKLSSQRMTNHNKFNEPELINGGYDITKQSIMTDQPKGIVGGIIVDAGPGLGADIRRLLREQLIAGYRPYPSLVSYCNWLSDTRPLLKNDICYRIAQSALRESADGMFWPRFDLNVLDLLSNENDDNWWWSALRRVALPVLIVRGAGSAILQSSVAARMARLLRHGKAVTISMAGHSVMSDNSDSFFAVARGFFRSDFPGVLLHFSEPEVG